MPADLSVREWYTTTPGRVPMPIMSIIRPNRYDVVARARLLRLIFANIPLFQRDFPAFMRLAHERTELGELAGPVNADWQEFAGRLPAPNDDQALADLAVIVVERLARVGDDMRLHGWKRRSRIAVIQNDADGSYHLGNGQHRLAALLALGHAALLPWQYVLCRYRTWVGWNATRLFSSANWELEDVEE